MVLTVCSLFLGTLVILSSVVTSVILDFDSDVGFYMFNKF